jgi:8-hydroxy-5-deazaflavin:NADPH oxidoreductase
VRSRPSCTYEQSSGNVVTGWLPERARLAMAFGTMSAELLESSADRSPEPAVGFYATDDDRAGEEVERLIRTAGFEPMRVGGVGESDRFEVGGGTPRSRGRPRRGAVFAHRDLTLTRG